MSFFFKPKNLPESMFLQNRIFINCLVITKGEFLHKVRTKIRRKFTQRDRRDFNVLIQNISFKTKNTDKVQKDEKLVFQGNYGKCIPT